MMRLLIFQNHWINRQRQIVLFLRFIGNQKRIIRIRVVYYYVVRFQLQAHLLRFAQHWDYLTDLLKISESYKN